MNLALLLRNQAESRPNAPALIEERRGHTQSLTFAQLDDAAGRAAALLRRQGLRAGDRVLLFHPIAADLYVALAAIFRLGLVATFVDPSMGRAHIDRCCALAPPQALLATPKAHLLRLLSPALRRIPVKFATGWGVPGAVSWQRWRRMTAEPEILDLDADAPALATFTSGSTGAPKMAVRSHGFLVEQHRALEGVLGLTPDDVVLTTLPIFVMSHLGSGAATLIPDVDLRHPGSVPPAPLVRQIQEWQIGVLLGSPAFVEQIARYCAANRLTLPSLRKIFTGGAPVFPDLLDLAQQMAPQAVVTAVYGSTEAEPVAHIAHQEISAADRAVMFGGGGLLAGCPEPVVQVRVLPDRWGTPLGPYTAAEFDQLCLPAGAVGELAVSGPHVLTGYWQGEGDAETKFRVDDTIWHRTGDAGSLDAQGRLWLLGRCAARVQDEHGTLYPFAVECAVHRFAEVKRAAFVAHRGRRLLALELHPDQQATPELLAALHSQLAWAHLAAIQFFPHLPVDKRHNAKLDYPALTRLLEKTD
jgi:acyl-CoA synthetase (AMP-forming)/AMP-acid ligase II